MKCTQVLHYTLQQFFSFVRGGEVKTEKIGFLFEKYLNLSRHSGMTQIQKRLRRIVVPPKTVLLIVFRLDP